MARNFDKEKVITMLSNIIFSLATLFGVLTVVLAFLIMSIGTSVFALTMEDYLHVWGTSGCSLLLWTHTAQAQQCCE